MSFVRNVVGVSLMSRCVVVVTVADHFPLLDRPSSRFSPPICTILSAYKAQEDSRQVSAHSLVSLHLSSSDTVRHSEQDLPSQKNSQDSKRNMLPRQRKPGRSTQALQLRPTTSVRRNSRRSWFNSGGWIDTVSFSGCFVFTRIYIYHISLSFLIG